MAVRQLPENYMRAEKISIKNNRKLVIGLNIGALILMIPFVIIGIRIVIGRIEEEMTFTVRFLPILLGAAGVVAVFVLHELVHGLFFKRYSGEKIKYGFTGAFAYAGVPDYYFTRSEYLVVGLAPFVILDAALIVGLFFAGGALFYILYVILTVHFAGCVGDLYVTWKLAKYPADTLIRDTGMEMEFYTRADLPSSLT